MCRFGSGTYSLLSFLGCIARNNRPLAIILFVPKSRERILSETQLLSPYRHERNQSGRLIRVLLRARRRFVQRIQAKSKMQPNPNHDGTGLLSRVKGLNAGTVLSTPSNPQYSPKSKGNIFSRNDGTGWKWDKGTSISFGQVASSPQYHSMNCQLPLWNSDDGKMVTISRNESSIRQLCSSKLADEVE